ncbi:MAG: protein kinase [Burkholderiales bacterium]|nr:protein kinase [Burkholderiales bacterium]
MTADASADDTINALPPGTRFGELEILGTLGVGGFGIVYLARDHSLEREIAIKEYMPSQFAQRDGRSQVSVRSISMRETFELGRRSFVNEARLLARFDHPSLLKVYRFWEANGTAYMAMPRLVGQNLREARRGLPAVPPPEAWARRVFDAVLGGLEALHAQQVWHRDVAPDNIFLPADGSTPILLDFGAARQAIGDRTQVFTAILKPSFAPIEQYAEAASLKQGPWTDFYALAAVMHELLTGRPPPPCTARAMGDELAPLAAPGYSPRFLAALDWALRVPPHQRPVSAAAWREVLDGRAPVPPPQAAPPRVAPAPHVPLDIEFADTVQALPEEMLRTTLVPPAQPARQAIRPDQPAPAAPPALPARRKGPLLLAAAALVLLLLGLFIGQLRGNMAPHGPPASADAASAAASAAADAQVVAGPVASVPAANVPAVVEAVSPPTVKPLPTTAAASSPAPRPAVAASVAPRRDGALKPIVTEKAGDYRPMPRSPVFAAPEPVASAATVPVQAAPASAPGEPRTASEACGSRVLLARVWCIDRQCEKPQFRGDPECVKLREIREQRNSHRDVP